MRNLFLALVCMVGLAGCTDEDAATSTLRGAGYTDIQFTGYGWFDCGGDDFSATSFRAKGPTGVPVEGAVCCGLMFKNCTIRH